MKRWPRIMALVMALVLTAAALAACNNAAPAQSVPAEPAGATEPSPQNLNATYNRPGEDIVYTNRASFESEAAYTGSIITAEIEDTRYGGPQFIAKLYTEGLSRAPEPEEYVAATAVIEEKGCSVETLTGLASDFFGGEAFLAAGLTERERLFAVYRAVLNREPTEQELAAPGFESAQALAEDLCATDAFAELLPGINRGPYFWGTNSLEAYTGDTVITETELMAMFEENDTVSLPQGALVLVSAPVAVPAGCTLQTEGNPAHYAKMARLMRVGGADYHMLIVNDDAVVKNIYVEGNLSAYPVEQVQTGSNVVVSGNNATVAGCRITDSVSHQNLWAIDATEHGYLAENLITGYASDHNKTWQDGISCLGTDFLIEHNDVVDVTDGCIAIFRYINVENEDKKDYYSRPQNTIVRYNTIVNFGNAAYVAYDHETGNYSVDKDRGPINPADMNGLVGYENRIWTSMRAHYHMVVTLSTVPWLTADNCDETIGGAVYNNYTPEGCYALTACGIAVDKVSGGSVRGNNFHLYIGNWNRPYGGMGPRIYSVNENNCTGDYQAGYTNRTMSFGGVPFVFTLKEGLELEAADSLMLKEAFIREPKQDIPAELFGEVARTAG